MDDSNIGPFHDSPSTPRNPERSLLDDDMDLEQPFLDVPLIRPGRLVILYMSIGVVGGAAVIITMLLIRYDVCSI
ncbi:hypothetical protein ROHU_000145 [Labeo rohita]|uniref:Uncharacterized protein n=1 Tax=Labeo rohita TaxID=84645 RepID=A0A498P7I8_LABRO|nr:hypothetical protein ROHU_000145 [Labeo rohita]